MKNKCVLALVLLAAVSAFALELPDGPSGVVGQQRSHDRSDFRTASIPRSSAPVWVPLERMSITERQNSEIDIILEDAAPDEARRLARTIAEDWNAGRWTEALAAFPRLVELVGAGDIAIGNRWRTPVPALDTRLWGNDVRVSNRDSAVLVNLDIDRSSGTLNAVLMFRGDSYTNFWTMNVSRTGGVAWAETYLWWATYGLKSLSASVLGDFCYIGFGRGGAQDQAFLYRCRALTGVQTNFNTGSAYITVATTSTNDSIKEVALTSNADFFNNRLYYMTLTTSGRLRYHWADTAAVNWDSTPGLTVNDALAGLDACTNEEYDSSFIFVSYYDQSNNVRVQARRGAGWSNLYTIAAGNVAPKHTAVGAYHDTVLVDFLYNAPGRDYARYAVSYNGGTSWLWGAAGGDTAARSESPDVALRAGGGTGVVYRYYTATRELRYSWRDYGGPWSTPVALADHEPFYNKPAIEYIGGGAYGVVYTSWLAAPQYSVYFDRSDWGTGLADQRRLIVEEGVLAVTPNPLRGSGRVRLNLAGAALLDVKVLDRAGRVVTDVYRGNRPAGRSELALDCSALAPGVYFLRATASGRPLTVPFTVVR